MHVPIVLKSGSLNLLESSGPLKACNRIDLPLPAIKNVITKYWNRNGLLNFRQFYLNDTELISHGCSINFGRV
jgi:hypothetical protein